MKQKLENPRAKILEAALIEFSQHSYEKASTNNISKLAKISKGTIFNYYESKENLFKQVLEYSISIFKKELNSFKFNSIEPKEIIKEAIRFIYNFYQQHQNIYNFYLRSIYDLSIPFRNELLKVVKLFSTLLTYRLIHNFKKLSILTPNYSEESLLYILNSLISRLIDSYFIENESPIDREKLFDEICSIISDILTTGDY
ncbi:MAG: TetR/AcrR family transcriptional regulator [Spirochaetota bacterium]